MSPAEKQAPPVGEEVHLPGPTLLPFACAIGITLAIIGTTISIWFTIVGVIVFLVTVVRWIRDTRRDVADLPEDHH